MEKYIEFSPDALDDLGEINGYISQVLKNPESADRIVNSILDEIERLAESPELGEAFVSRFGIPTDLRYLVVGKYIVIYRNAGDRVRIIHVFYGKRNYLKILFG